jgi:hypothetical protein
MVNKKIIDEFVSFIVLGLRHRIGSIVNDNELYAKKYAKDAEEFFKAARKTIIGITFNVYETAEIKKSIKSKLSADLTSKPFLRERKFEIMDAEIEKVLLDFGFNHS